MIESKATRNALANSRAVIDVNGLSSTIKYDVIE